MSTGADTFTNTHHFKLYNDRPGHLYPVSPDSALLVQPVRDFFLGHRRTQNIFRVPGTWYCVVGVYGGQRQE